MTVSKVNKHKFSESKTVELKEKYTKSLQKTVSAFSIYHDGTIYIEIDNLGNVIGFSRVNEVKVSIENSINNSITPKPFFDMNILKLITRRF
jgi:ATP-dependent DNA helicase RecG